MDENHHGPYMIFTTTHIIRASQSHGLRNIWPFCAVGGYGPERNGAGIRRGLIVLDLRTLRVRHIQKASTEYILYMLWDMGLKVGHSTRTLEQNIKLAKSDQTILTALLDLRFLCGDEDMVHDLFARFRKDVARGKGRDFITAKLEET